MLRLFKVVVFFFIEEIREDNEILLVIIKFVFSSVHNIMVPSLLPEIN